MVLTTFYVQILAAAIGGKIYLKSPATQRNWIIFASLLKKHEEKQTIVAAEWFWSYQIPTLLDQKKARNNHWSTLNRRTSWMKPANDICSTPKPTAKNKHTKYAFRYEERSAIEVEAKEAQANQSH